MAPVRIARVPLKRLSVSQQPCTHRSTAATYRSIATDSSAPHPADNGQGTSGFGSDKQELSKERISHNKKKKTIAQQDEELRAKLENSSGDGGSAGVEYENGKAQGLKSQVKNNMFRVI